MIYLADIGCPLMSTGHPGRQAVCKKPRLQTMSTSPAPLLEPRRFIWACTYIATCAVGPGKVKVSTPSPSQKKRAIRCDTLPNVTMQMFLFLPLEWQV